MYSSQRRFLLMKSSRSKKALFLHEDLFPFEESLPIEELSALFISQRVVTVALDLIKNTVYLFLAFLLTFCLRVRGRVRGRMEYIL